jgi:hypothetical protein
MLFQWHRESCTAGRQTIGNFARGDKIDSRGNLELRKEARPLALEGQKNQLDVAPLHKTPKSADLHNKNQVAVHSF